MSRSSSAYRMVIMVSIMLFVANVCHAQDADYQIDSTAYLAPSGVPAENWQVKVTWIDRHGKKQRTKGWLMLAMEDKVMVASESPSGRTRQRVIDTEDIWRIKFKPSGYSEVPNILLGAADGALSGGVVPIATGNFYVDILSGAVQGALTGLLNTAGASRSVLVRERRSVYLQRVYPILAGERWSE